MKLQSISELTSGLREEQSQEQTQVKNTVEEITDDMKKTSLEEQTDKPKKIKVVLAVPGNNFSSKVFVSWINTLNVLWNQGKYDIVVSPGISSYVTFARIQTFGASVLRGVEQKLFNGHEFDVLLSIDSDIVFSAEHVMEMIESAMKKKVVAGMYRMSNLQNYAFVKDWDVEYFLEHSTFEFATPEGVEEWRKAHPNERYMEVAYSGMGMFAIHSSVLNNLTYPYFNGDLFEIKDKNGKLIREMFSEDVCLCKNIQKLGYKVWVDTSLRVGHLKEMVV